jgi:hypothetical protein
MSVARRGGSGAASASLYWSLKQRVQYAFDSSIRGGCCFLDERVRRASCAVNQMGTHIILQAVSHAGSAMLRCGVS